MRGVYEYGWASAWNQAERDARKNPPPTPDKTTMIIWTVFIVILLILSNK